MNGHPGDPYRFAARNKEQLKESAGLVAPTTGLRMPSPPIEDKKTGLWVPPPSEVVESKPAPVVDPKAGGWLL